MRTAVLQNLPVLMADLASMLEEGRALEERRHFEEAIAVYVRARALYPAAGECHLALGRVYARERRYPEAVNAYFQAGGLLLDADHPDEAHRAYSALIGLEKELAAGYSPPALQRIHSRRGDVAHGMARILYLRGSHEQALRLATTALESEPTHIGLRTTLGLVHLEAGREAEAMEQFPAVVKMHRGNLDEARCRERLAPLLAQQGAPAATVHDHYLHAGLFYEREGKLESALKAFGAALQLDPNHEKTLIHSAGVLLTLGRHDEAANLLQRLEGDGASLPRRLKVLFLLESDYTSSGRAEQALYLRRRVEGLSGYIILRDLIPDADLILPTPTTGSVRRIPSSARAEGFLRLDFPAVNESSEGRAGSVWLKFHPELQSNQDVLGHMCELLREPAEKLIPHVRSGKTRIGEVVRLSHGDFRYDYAFVAGGVLFVRAMASLPALDWGAARLVEPGAVTF